MSASRGSGSLYDVAIIGAGPAGSASAIYLARAGLRVALIDRASFPRDKPCAEYLSPAVEPLLADLGALDALEATGPARLRGFRIFTQDGRMFQGDFSGAHDSRSPVRFETGLAIPRSVLDDTLVRVAMDAGAELHLGWRVSDVIRDAAKGVWRLAGGAAESQGQLVARLLIGADGVHSVVARRLGLRRRSGMRKIAIVAHVSGIEGLSAYGEMHIADHRYVGVAPLKHTANGVVCNVAMVVDERREGRALAGQPQDYLLNALGAFPCLRERVGPLHVIRPALTTSGICARVTARSSEGALLVGDAAGYYDPFTGEGIYRALRSAEIASVIARTAVASGDVSARRLRQYDRAYSAAFRGKRAVEMAIQAAVQHPPLMAHIARRLETHKRLADTIVGVTGDFLPPAAVLRPDFLLRLII